MNLFLGFVNILLSIFSLFSPKSSTLKSSKPFWDQSALPYSQGIIDLSN